MKEKAKTFQKQDFGKKFQKFCSLNMTFIACLFAKREKIIFLNILNDCKRFHIILDEYHNK